MPVQNSMSIYPESIHMLEYVHDVSAAHVWIKESALHWFVTDKYIQKFKKKPSCQQNSDKSVIMVPRKPREILIADLAMASLELLQRSLIKI